MHDRECEEFSEACGCQSRYELIMMVEKLRKFIKPNQYLNKNHIYFVYADPLLEETDLSRWK